MKPLKTLVCLLILAAAVNLSAQTAANNCICPVITITEPDRILQPGEPATFTAEIKGDKNQTTYNWTVSAGTIISGQGTKTISVETNGLSGANVTATVTVGGWCPACENLSASGAVNIAERISGDFDDFVLGNCEELLARLDAFYSQLNNQPAAMGYILILGKSHQASRAESQIKRAIKFRSFDLSRVVTVRVDGANEQAEIRLRLAPPGAESPASDLLAETENPSVKPTQPYLFSIERDDEIGGCEAPLDLEGFAKTLKESPNSRGNIVIMFLSKSEFRAKQKEILSFLIKKGIARRRLKTFHRKSFGGVELWILP